MKRFLKDLKHFYKYAIAAGQAELHAEVAGSYLNWLWWVIEPFCFMLIYSFVFGTLFASKVQYFNIFIYIGVTMWTFFNNTLISCVQVVKNNKAIISKVYLPKFILILVKMYVNAFKLFINFIIVFVLIIYNRIPITMKVLWIIPVLLTLFLLTFGICLFLAHFGVYVHDLTNVVRIVLRMLFYLTGIFYDISVRGAGYFGEEGAQKLLRLNPIAFLISEVRNVMIYNTPIEGRVLITWFIVAVILSIFGVRLIYRSENNYVKVI